MLWVLVRLRSSWLLVLINSIFSLSATRLSLIRIERLKRNWHRVVFLSKLSIPFLTHQLIQHIPVLNELKPNVLFGFAKRNRWLGKTLRRGCCSHVDWPSLLIEMDWLIDRLLQITAFTLFEFAFDGLVCAVWSLLAVISPCRRQYFLLSEKKVCKETDTESFSDPSNQSLF